MRPGHNEKGRGGVEKAARARIWLAGECEDFTAEQRKADERRAEVDDRVGGVRGRNGALQGAAVAQEDDQSLRKQITKGRVTVQKKMPLRYGAQARPLPAESRSPPATARSTGKLCARMCAGCF